MDNIGCHWMTNMYGPYHPNDIDETISMWLVNKCDW